MQKNLSKNESYRPAEDTFFLADYLENEKGASALDIGTGSGYLAKILSSNFSLVVATDVDFHSLRAQNEKFPNLICCNAADAIRIKFDLIVCNMPYLPSEKLSDRTIDGGKDGVEIPLKIIKSAKRCLDNNGKFLFLVSSLGNFQNLLEKTKDLGFDVQIIGTKKLFYEKLILVKGVKKDLNQQTCSPR